MAKTSAETQRERTAQGKCCNCERQRTHGCRCFKHWLKMKKQSPIFAKRLKLGMCGSCGKHPPLENEEICQVCKDGGHLRKPAQPKKEKQPRVVFDKPFHQRNVEAGYCSTGGPSHPRPEPPHSQCYLCLAKRSERSRTKKARAKQRVYKNKQYANKKTRGLCTEDGCWRVATHGTKCEEHRLRDRKKDKLQRNKLRAEAFAQYGGYHCSCPGCRCNDPEFLELDHINNDGAEHRRQLTGKNAGCGVKTLYDLKKRGWPKIMQPMCGHCNKSKAKHGGVCKRAGTPHNAPMEKHEDSTTE